MSRPTPQDTRTRLEKVINDGVTCALALKKTLGDERAALQRRDTSTLSQAIEIKETQIRELATLEERRGHICAAAGFDAALQDMRAVTDWCDNDLSIHDGWLRLRAIAADCDSLNLGNGAIIRLRQQQIADGLALLRGAEREADIYGPTGVTGNTPAGRAITEA